MGESRYKTKIKQIIKDWATRERVNNPSFSLVIGRQALSIDQIEEHIDKNTELGIMLEDMILEAAADMFLPHQKPH